MERRFDRAAETVGNVVELQHINLRVPDQGLATLFYVAGLGFTRDPYVMVSTNNMWINLGTSQIHLPTGGPDILRGTIGLVVPDRAALLQRLAGVKQALKETRFAYTEHDDSVEVTCPWGNRYRLHAPDAKRFGSITLGMPYVAFTVECGKAAGIARFYRETLRTDAKLEDDEDGCFAKIQVGPWQHFIFREIAQEPPPYDLHHIQLYVTDFSGLHKTLDEFGLLTADVLEHEYRFKNIIDLDTRTVLFTVEHEIRSLRHPLRGRPLINRDPAQTNVDYRPGHDDMPWTLGAA